MEREAVVFVQKHVKAESAPLETSINAVRGHYADVVFYYGEHLSKQIMLQKYDRFLKRWPERQYHIRPDSINVICFPSSGVCNFSGIIDWVAISRPRHKRSEGHSSWSYALLKQGDRFVITSVNGEVLKRRINDLSEGAIGIERN